MRLEKDYLGSLELPDEVYYGVQTGRAVQNFPISGLKAHPELIRALGMIKKAAVVYHRQNGMLSEEKANAIEKACDEVIDGRWNGEFVVDVYQAGAGTSLNMNVNEVIANRALEILGRPKGDYEVIHPNDHVNMSQSTNDVFPTAMRIAILKNLPGLLKSLNELEKTLGGITEEYRNCPTAGRTHLQDALPVTVGQLFSSYAQAILEVKKHLAEASKPLMELGIGGTAVGTGLNAPENYRYSMVALLSGYTGIPLKVAPNSFYAMNSMHPFTNISSALKNLALELSRIASDIRLLASGPNTGFNELQLPAVQPGSSIMPGKINPVMAEMLNMVCFQVVGNNQVVTLAAEAGQLQLNVMMPVIIFNILWSMDILINAINSFNHRCLKGLKVNEERCRRYFESTTGLGAVLNTYLGFHKTAELVKESQEKGKTIREIVLERGLLKQEEVERIFDVQSLTEPGIPGKRND